ncbi:MAG: SDR family NAD(P)-dependent oxidoreductase, partial [Acidobacteriota bacterium]|nr:SDR family NAD(P)-dependent oxidoreductase [Acidobacteriota bacterium]
MDENNQALSVLPRDLFRGRVAVVTGGSRGIGRATALRLAEAGAAVVISYLQNEEAAEDVVRECRALDVEALAVRSDASDLKGANALTATTL